MSKASDVLGAVGIHNSHIAARMAGEAGVQVAVYVAYRTAFPGRAPQSAAWQVIRPGFHTDPKGYWRDNGHKTFDVRSRDEREQQLKAALNWACERYGVQEWVKIPGLPGAWFPSEIADFVAAKVKEGKA